MPTTLLYLYNILYICNPFAPWCQCSWDGGDCCPSSCVKGKGKCENFDCKDPTPIASAKNLQPEGSGLNAGSTVAIVVVVLILLAVFGAGGFFVVRKFMYRKGKTVRPKKNRKFKQLETDVDDEEEIETLTAAEVDDEEEMEEDDDPMGTLLSR